MSFVENVPGRGGGGGAKVQAARRVVAAKDSEACGAAAGGGREGALEVWRWEASKDQSRNARWAMGWQAGVGGGGF